MKIKLLLGMGNIDEHTYAYLGPFAIGRGEESMETLGAIRTR